MNKLINDKELTKFGEALSKVSRIVVTCHMRPDGDAIGSSLGAMHLLRAIGKFVTVVVPDTPPRSLSFLPGFNEIAINTQHDEYIDRELAEADMIICLDFNKASRQGRLEEKIQNAPGLKVLIDHHQEPDDFAQILFSYPDMSSTCELAFRIFSGLGLYLEMNKECATCLVAGMVTDTRNFSVNTKNPDIYEVLMKLLEKGVDKTMIVREALETRSYWSLKLETYALGEKMEIFPQHHASVITLDKDELKKYRYQKGDTEGIVNKPLEIRGMICSFFLRQDDEYVKISARSVKEYPVSEICSEIFGGGGHRMAAGAEFKGSLEDCREKLIEAFPEFDKYLPKHLENIEM